MKPLTDREHEVLGLLCLGKRNSQIAADLHVSSETVKSHLTSIYLKMDVSSRYVAIAKANRDGTVRPVRPI